MGTFLLPPSRGAPGGTLEDDWGRVPSRVDTSDEVRHILGDDAPGGARPAYGPRWTVRPNVIRLGEEYQSTVYRILDCFFVSDPFCLMCAFCVGKHLCHCTAFTSVFQHRRFRVVFGEELGSSIHVSVESCIHCVMLLFEG